MQKFVSIGIANIFLHAKINHLFLNEAFMKKAEYSRSAKHAVEILHRQERLRFYEIVEWIEKNGYKQGVSKTTLCQIEKGTRPGSVELQAAIMSTCDKYLRRKAK